MSIKIPDQDQILNNITVDTIIEQYQKSSHGQACDYTNNIGWEFSGPQYIYRENRDKIMSYEAENHIFWQDVHTDIQEGLFNKDKLTFNVQAGPLDEDNTLTETVYNKTIDLLDDYAYIKLRDLIVPEYIIEAYAIKKEKDIQAKHDNLIKVFDYLNSKNVKCDITCGSPVGVFIIDKETFLKESTDRTSLVCYQLADKDGKSIDVDKTIEIIWLKEACERIQNNEEVPSSEFSMVNFESEAFNSLGDDVKETITNYVNERSDAINARALEQSNTKNEQELCF